MATMVMPPDRFKAIIERRRRYGQDSHDEVWNGVYVMSPIADIAHQQLIGSFTKLLIDAISTQGAIVFPGVNVSDRADDWTRNYRVPDVAVFMPGNPAENRETHFLGGPDFLVEVVSKYDRSRRKLDFYASIGVREVLLVNRAPWRLDMYRLKAGELELAATSHPDGEKAVESEVLGLSFRLIPAEPGPRIEATDLQNKNQWLI
jgi:Uma2 family endonuclease